MSPSSATGQEFVLIDTGNGICGDFDNQSTSTDDGLDYQVSKGYASEDGTNYNLGCKLAWTDGGAEQETGTSTLAQGDMKLKLYSEANWWHGPGSQSMTFDGVTVYDDLPDDRFEAKFGVQGQINKAVSVWGTVGLEAGSEDYRAGTALVGVRYVW